MAYRDQLDAPCPEVVEPNVLFQSIHKQSGSWVSGFVTEASWESEVVFFFMSDLENRALTRRSRHNLSILSALKPSPLLCLVKRRLIDWNGAVEQTSKMNQEDKYLNVRCNGYSGICSVKRVKTRLEIVVEVVVIFITWEQFSLDHRLGDRTGCRGMPRKRSEQCR